MDLRQLLFTNNDCYKANIAMKPSGVMWHSTGANNPMLKRYVGPDDGALGRNLYNNHWNRPRPDGRQVCPHAFIGKLNNGKIATYQTLPWDIVGWHAGGKANQTHIGFEICEDDLNDAVYFNKVYQEAVELTAFLCKLYSLDPMKDGVVICHSEGARRGIASNHADVMHWFPKFGKSMDTARADVKKLLVGTSSGLLEVGTLVNFKGGKHYVSANANEGSAVQAGPARITARVAGAKHPYHIISENKAETTVYGWVDADTISVYNSELVRIRAAALNIHQGPGTNYKIQGAITDKGVYTIVDTKNGWGKLKSGVGWIDLGYTEKI